MSQDETKHRRRYGVIEVHYRTFRTLAMYNLSINGKLWAYIEWSPSRKGWCIQDASGRCLAHCDAIQGQDVDAQTAVKLAKAMIRDGRMPCPEDAHEQLEERLRRDRLGEPMELLALREPMEPVADVVSVRRHRDESGPIISITDVPSRRRRRSAFRFGARTTLSLIGDRCCLY
jgi:hypothetical protein